MENGTWWKLRTALVFLLLVVCPDLLAQLQFPQTKIDVLQGQTVMLPAFYIGSVADLTQATVIWNWNQGSNPEMIISYAAGTLGYGDKFAGRVGFMTEMPNTNLSIFINKTSESDSGTCMCQVVLPGKPGSPKELTLTVKVPPSIPVCKLEGNPVVKANVTLTCSSSAGKPVPTYKWNKQSPSPEFFFPPSLDVTVGTLKLTNLSTSMSGKYECTAFNSAGQTTCYINLDVKDSSTAGVIAGATIGALLGIVLIVLFLGFLWWKRKKDTEEDLANDIKEDAQAPKRVSWARSGTGSDIISKNGTLSSYRSSPQPQDTHNHYHHQYSITHPTSDTASIITTTGSTVFRPRPTGLSSAPENSLVNYNTDAMIPHAHPAASSFNGGSLSRTETLQASSKHLVPPSSGISAANISRMGGVPIMVPAQNQAGSLV